VKKPIVIGTKRQPISWILRTPTSGGSNPRHTAADMTITPLTPVSTSDREQTNSRDRTATFLEHSR